MTLDDLIQKLVELRERCPGAGISFVNHRGDCDFLEYTYGEVWLFTDEDTMISLDRQGVRESLEIEYWEAKNRAEQLALPEKATEPPTITTRRYSD